MVDGRHRAVVQTLAGRKTDYLIAAKAKDRQARRIRCTIEQRFVDLPPGLRRTITFDNGKDISGHEILARRTGLVVYFAHPYRSWQCGTIENTNRLLR